SRLTIDVIPASSVSHVISSSRRTRRCWNPIPPIRSETARRSAITQTNPRGFSPVIIFAIWASTIPKPSNPCSGDRRCDASRLPGGFDVGDSDHRRSGHDRQGGGGGGGDVALLWMIDAR